MEEQRASKTIGENPFLKIWITKSMAYYWIEFGSMDALRRKGRLPGVPSVAVAKNHQDFQRSLKTSPTSRGNMRK
jgi:hypothetical protein